MVQNLRIFSSHLLNSVWLPYRLQYSRGLPLLWLVKIVLNSPALVDVSVVYSGVQWCTVVYSGVNEGSLTSWSAGFTVLIHVILYQFDETGE